MRALTLLFILAVSAAPAAHAATRAETVTPSATSVEVLQSQMLSARFFDAAGNPSVGEMVMFSNDACGTFPNGMSQIQVATGAGGIASTTFTAGAETGLTCFVRAAAGAQATFRVITYRLNQVVLGVTVLAVPNPPLAGRAFTIEAFAKLDAIELPNIDFTVRVIDGASSASLSSPGGGTGAQTRFQVNVFPEGVLGDFEIELDFRGKKRRFPVSGGAIATSYQDMWWAGGGQNGWGMSIVQHGDTIFAVLFVYDNDGRPTWYVMSGGTWDATHSVYTGPLYSPRGSPFFAYDASSFQPGTPVGTLAITFNDASHAFIDYTIGAQSGTKGISRQPFGSNLQSPMPNRGDMFWGGVAQNGWGVAALQQYDALFIVWFTYDAAGLPTWFVLPAGAWTPAGTYEGRLYRTTSSGWLGTPYVASQLTVTDAGPFRMRFTDGSPSALDYTVDARTGTLTLMRQGF